MDEIRCKICEEVLEEKYLKEQKKCILHCEKDEKNGWYSLKTDGSKKWDESKLELFWNELNRHLNESNKLNFNFKNCYFYKDVELKKNTFDNLFVFEGCKVYKKIEFRNITFKGTKFGKLKIDNISFKEESNFLNIKNEDGKKLESKNIANRETARIIKHSFEKLDNIIEANKFYALEMQKQEKELSLKDNFSEKLVFMAHKISSNHSQDSVLALLWIIVIGFLASFFEFFTEIDKDTQIYYNLTILNKGLVFIFISYMIINFLVIKEKVKFCTGIMASILYAGYSVITNDFLLSDFAKVLNPFSIA